jgi:SAM-dependent methyltransferase
MDQLQNEDYKNRWDDRYKHAEYAYGKEPNLFFRNSIEKIAPGALLLPADGEGRNGVYAAQIGWEVTSSDLSTEAKSKALQLAQEKKVTLNYVTGDIEKLDFPIESFDAIGLIYAHFEANKKSACHRKLNRYLKPGGLIIFESFSKKHLEFNTIDPKVGGPKELDMLFSIEEISTDFEHYVPLLLEEKEIELKEGAFHIGKGSVIRFIGRKRNS